MASRKDKKKTQKSKKWIGILFRVFVLMGILISYTTIHYQYSPKGFIEIGKHSSCSQMN